MTGPVHDSAGVEEWNEAYVTVESYLRALGLRNQLLLGRLVVQVIGRAEDRVRADPSLRPSSAAMEEIIRLAADWFSTVADVKLPENRLAARGRLALLLADLPGKYQDCFLADPPLPAEVVRALRESYRSEGPKLQRRAMVPRPIKLNPIMRQATEWWEDLNRTPIAGSRCRRRDDCDGGGAPAVFLAVSPDRIIQPCGNDDLPSWIPLRNCLPRSIRPHLSRRGPRTGGGPGAPSC